MQEGEKRKKFTDALFRWHKRHYRDMPWRRIRDPYQILVSEVMLQQTQVRRVRTKYTEFLKSFPDVHALARAPLGAVLRAWSGLGYNRRARYLHECAKIVATNYDGKFPSDMAKLRALPGIGLSTAGALLAFAFGKDEPMVDTNIRRTLSRVFFKGKAPNDRVLYDFAKSLIPRGKGRVWNYAMLDLGATLCAARNHSPECPLRKLHGNVGDFQYKKPQKKFADSDRYHRGRIVALLTLRDTATPHAIEGTLGIASKKVREITEKLLKEGLLKKRGRLFMLP